MKGAGDRLPDAACFYLSTDSLRPGRFTFCTATDGNHGRGVAWTARKLRQRSVIFMPKGTVPARIQSIESEGADVRIVNGSYDDAVKVAAQEAEKHAWQMISDTSWPGYTDIPRWINAGYTTIFREIQDMEGSYGDIDVVVIQAGVGALAAAAAWHYNKVLPPAQIKLIAVEPIVAACLLESVRSANGRRTEVEGSPNTIMAGLNCGTPSLVAWPLVKLGFDLFMTVSDDYAIRAMRTYYDPSGDDPRVVSGESGAAGLAALMALSEDTAASGVREKLGITPDSTILLLNTEGDTDPVMFDSTVKSKPGRTV
jgi:diaminopropionate ammonia-lyase